LTVVSEAMSHVQSVALGFWVGIGSRDEPGSAAGAAHFLEHLLFKGTASRSAREIAELIDAVGGELNAFTAKDHSAFYVRVMRNDLAVALDVLCDIMWRPAFRPADVESERQVILEELLMRGDDPEDLVLELLSASLFPGHPLGREVLGDEDSIESMSVADLRTFHHDNYRPGAMLLAAAGAVDHDALVVAVEERFSRAGRESGGSRSPRLAPHRPLLRTVVQRRPSEQAHVALGLPTVDRHHPDRHALTLLTQILGGGVSSRLFQEVRERRGLAYSVYADRVAYDDAGALTVYAGATPRRAAEVLDVLHAELDRLEDGVSERELSVAKGNVIGGVALGLEDSGARMHRIGRSLLLHGEVPMVDEVVARFGAVTLDDIARVARSVAVAPRALAVVGPFDDSHFATVEDVRETRTASQ
jgi:predicted Zn-dependent peptidase